MRRPLVMLLAILVVPMIAPAQDSMAVDPVAQLVARLDLERYKATIKGLTNFGDRRQGTDRNRAAVDWIEAQQQRERLLVLDDHDARGHGGSLLSGSTAIES